MPFAGTKSTLLFNNAVRQLQVISLEDPDKWCAGLGETRAYKEK